MPRRIVEYLKKAESRKTDHDFRKFLGLQVWPFALILVWFLQIFVAPPPPQVPAAGMVIDTLCWFAIIASGASVVRPSQVIRWSHLFFGFVACFSRSLYSIFGYANTGYARQLLGASLWGALAIGVLTVYVMCLPYVIDHDLKGGHLL